MSFAEITRSAFLTGLLSAVCLGSSAAEPDVRTVENLSLPFVVQGDWEIGHSAGDQKQRVVEFVRPGQTVHNWTELVTAQTFDKAVGLVSAQKAIAGHGAELGARCPGSTTEVVSELPDGILYESDVVNCEEGADERVLARLLDGSSNRFIVQYSVRGAVAMTSKRRTEWIEKLMAAQILVLPRRR